MMAGQSASVSSLQPFDCAPIVLVLRLSASDLSLNCEILSNRFGVGLTEKECVDLMVRMRDDAFKSWRTGAYDMLQRALGTA
jgi:hypothetical protein